MLRGPVRPVRVDTQTTVSHSKVQDSTRKLRILRSGFELRPRAAREIRLAPVRSSPVLKLLPHVPSTDATPAMS